MSQIALFAALQRLFIPAPHQVHVRAAQAASALGLDSPVSTDTMLRVTSTDTQEGVLNHGVDTEYSVSTNQKRLLNVCSSLRLP